MLKIVGSGKLLLSLADGVILLSDLYHGTGFESTKP